jgi:subtilisin
MEQEMMGRPSALGLACLLAWLAAAPMTASATAAAAPARPYIVVFTDEAATKGVLHGEDFTISRVAPGLVEQRLAAVAESTGVVPTQVYSHVLPGFAAELTAAQLAELRADPSVATIIRDRPIRAAEARIDRPASGGTVSLASGAVVPTGIRRIRATESSVARIDGVDQRVPGNVAVLDTGISNHRDLNVGGGINCTSSGGSTAWGDVNGHGTHVAGTIGALDNGFGVVGVAPGVKVWAVKVLDDSALGSTSWALCGLDYVARRNTSNGEPFFTAVNMSISGALDARGDCTRTPSVYQAATCRVMASGTPVVVAAGNKSRDARYYRPGAYENVITVSALADFDGKPGGLGRQADVCPAYSADSDDTFANFSNYGPDVDIIAPGKCILSTYPGGRYSLMSGTSMATPHVAGAVALYRAQYPGALPNQIKQALQAAGRLDWRTTTDPDGNPEPLLRVSAFGPPPTFEIGIDDTAPFIGLDMTLRVPVKALRTNGHRDPITLSTGALPSAVSSLTSVITGKSGELRIRSSAGVQSGQQKVQVRATDGELTSRATFTLRIDAERPVADFETPDESSLRLSSQAQQDLSWTESDSGGSGLASRSLQRQSGTIVEPGSCRSVTWKDAGNTLEAPPPSRATSLGAGLCHRWRLRVTDGARNVTTTLSGSLLVDTDPPPAPTIEASGQDVWVGNPAGPAWFSPARAGSLQLRVRGADPHSGDKQLRTTALDPSAGWQGPGATTFEGKEAQLSLSWQAGAPGTSLQARSTDRVGLVGPWATFEIRPDAQSPQSASWTTPEASSFTFARAEVTLAYAGGSDAGSGLDPLARIGRRSGTIVREGTCDGAVFAADGQVRPRASGSVESGLASGTCYRWSLFSVDRVGNAGTTRSSGTVLVDALVPTAGFGAPFDGAPLAYDTDGRVTIDVTWADEGGSGVASRRLQRQASRAEAGTCAGTWANDGSAVTPPPIPAGATFVGVPQTGLTSGRCYRWKLNVTDRSGNRRALTSPSLLVDADAPPPARVSVAAGDAWAEGPSGPVWFRAGREGGFTLRSAPQEDAISGIGGSRFGGLSPQSGWADGTGATTFVKGLQADRAYQYGASARDATLEVTSRDRAGNWGAPLSVALRADDRPPEIQVVAPADGTTRLASRSVVLEFTDRDRGSGVSKRTLQRQRAPISGDADCSSVTWSDDGTIAVATSGMRVADLAAGWCYRWEISVRDRVGNVGRAMTGAVRLARDVSIDVQRVAAELRTGQVSSKGTAPARLGWTVVTQPAGLKVAQDVASTKDDGATWTSLARGQATSSLSVGIGTGKGTVFSVRARDQDGRQSAWAVSRLTKLKLLAEDSPAVTLAGEWKRVSRSAALGGRVARSGTAGASATIVTEGAAVGVIASVGPSGGSISVRLDGSVVARMALKAAAAAHRQLVVVVPLTESGPRTLEVRVKGDGNVDLDGFVVLSRSATAITR